MAKEYATPTVAQSESLSGKVILGGKWVFGLRILSRGLGFVRTIILAKLLSPHDFGLLGIALLAISTLETFSQTGFQAALIQKNEEVDSYLDTAWTVSACRGIIIFVVLFLFAPLVAKFFNTPDASLVIRVIAISTLISGFGNIGVLFFHKDLEFNKQFIYIFSGTLVDLVVSVSLAFALRNVWALVLGGLAGQLTRLIASYAINPYHPKIRFDVNKWRALFGYGKWVLVSSILIFLVTKGDDIFVGKILGVTALGIYQLAYLISNTPTTEISHVISTITFPVYSKIQNDVIRLKSAYHDVLQMNMFVAIPLAGGIFVLIPEFTQLFIGQKWMPLVHPVRILVLAGVVRSIAATTGPVIYGVGQPKVETMWQSVRLAVLAISIYPLSLKFGLVGVSYAVLISMVIPTFGFCAFVIRRIEMEIKKFLVILVVPFINGLVVSISVNICKSLMGTIGFIEFFILIGLGGALYTLIALILTVTMDYEVKEIVQRIIKTEA